MVICTYCNGHKYILGVEKFRVYPRFHPTLVGWSLGWTREFPTPELYMHFLRWHVISWWRNEWRHTRLVTSYYGGDTTLPSVYTTQMAEEHSVSPSILHHKYFYFQLDQTHCCIFQFELLLCKYAICGIKAKTHGCVMEQQYLTWWFWSIYSTRLSASCKPCAKSPREILQLYLTVMIFAIRYNHVYRPHALYNTHDQTTKAHFNRL